MYVTLSPNMREMVRICAESRNGITLEVAHGYSQTSFGAVMKRGRNPKKLPHQQGPKWLEYDRAKERFFPTEELKEVNRNYDRPEIFRSESRYSAPLTKYFDPKAYGLHIATRKRAKVA